jgi:HAD superfamily phosphoserine phosphatase-like hydrolase
MSLQPLVVLDLDGTLVPYDSLRRYCLRLLPTPARWSVLTALLRRALRLDSAVELLDRLDVAVQKLDDAQAFHRRFADDLCRDLVPDVLSFVRRRVSMDALIVLCSASPTAYVSPLCQTMNWKCLASGRQADGKMIRIYGLDKLETLQRMYPSSSYAYAYALADSKSDIPLLRRFHHAYLVTIENGKVVIDAFDKANAAWEDKNGKK